MSDLRVVTSFPHAVRRIEHLSIPLADGCRLAARLWLPAGADRTPVPAVVEYIPYGKRIGTRDRDDAIHAWFAGHGYASLRIDLRGSGESEGVLLDEYLPQEQFDGAEAIAWIAAQPWCNGAVGLFGKSWGGFNALQIAALRPPALRAVLTICSTDDRYADDVHYMGGCLLNDNLWWGAVFFQLVAQPPDPLLMGPAWRDLWHQRLAAAEPHPLRWLRHPLRDDYWKQGSVCEDYAAIACPVYAVGGWADAYTNAVPRLLSGLAAPRRALVGPWGHAYAHEASPGPAIGFLQEARAWWDRWLKGVDNGIESQPAYRVWMQESVAPVSGLDDRPGRWIAETGWPGDGIEPRTLHLSEGRLGPPGPEARLEVRSRQTTGAAAGGWLVSSLRDQGEDDARSLCFDSEPLVERTEILGAPELQLVVSADRPHAFVAVRLVDVAPDGRATRVSYGLRNLTHSANHESWQPLVPGRPLEVRVALNHVAHAFPAGHRLRIAISPCYWPLVWPSPQPVALTVHTEPCRLVLPVRQAAARDAELPPFEAPECAPRSEWTPITRGGFERTAETDGAGDVVARMRSGHDEAGGVAMARCADADDYEGGDAVTVETRIHPADPLRARARMGQRSKLRREGWSVAVETDVSVSCSADRFRVEARLEAWEDGAPAFERHWDEEVPREGV